jgi:hypothetical protein
MSQDAVTETAKLAELHKKSHRVGIASLQTALDMLKEAKTSSDYESILPLLESVQDSCMSCLSFLRTGEALSWEDEAGPQAALSEAVSPGFNFREGRPSSLHIDKEKVVLNPGKINPSRYVPTKKVLEEDIEVRKEPSVGSDDDLGW